MRRPAPRPLAAALTEAVAEAAPDTSLSRVQRCWADVVGPAVAAEARPVAERSGTLTVECRSAVWASELELLGPDLLARLNAALGPTDVPLARLHTRSSGAG